MIERIVSQRELNRALLARQYLLERQQMSVSALVSHLVGLQAQIPNPPYIGLWTRLADFQREELTRLMQEGQIVRVAMMRSTLMLMTAEDHQHFRTTIQPALTRALAAFYGKRAKGLNIEKLLAAAKPFIEETPRT
ncbi:MAG: winged helix DNA-binding domain-containing protein, partial [Anaerolineae bacterium]|nr:winged helix DNA-binding domain-containing protein [Anaerolineae bacterium]